MPASSDPSRRFVLPENSPILGNLAALWACDPDLAAALESTLIQPPYPVEASKSGVPTIALPTGPGAPIYLHSRYQPVDEAKRLIDSADLEGKTIFCVHGLGLGYHVEQLFERVSDEAIILVFEPELQLIRTAFEHRDFSRLLRSGRLMFVTTADRTAIMLKLGNQQALVAVGVGHIFHAPSLQLRAAFHREAQASMAEFLAFCRTSLNTLVLNSRRTCENIAHNLAWYAAAPGINALRNRHAEQAAIIVSAGPSLRKNKHLLKDAQGKVVLIAVQTTLQPLLEMGIEPEYVTSLDYHDICTRFFEKLPAHLRTVLVAEPKASSAVLELYPGPLCMLGNEFADKLLREMKIDKDRLRAGATVAHLAFYLARYMGCDPVIFVGQDLGFSDGLCYTPGTSYEDVWRPELNRFCTVEMKQWEQIARERPILRRIEDYQGNAMYTEERLFTYLQQFERDFAMSRCRILDCTEGGAKKRGAEIMPLAAALAGRKKGPGVFSIPNPCQWNRLPSCLQSLRDRQRESQQIEQISRDTSNVLAELRGCIEDQNRSTRLIARIDALHQRMMQLNDCYELVTLLSQQTELARFRCDRRIAASKLSGLNRQRRQLDRDIANVQAIIGAAQEFRKLINDVIDRISAIDASKRRSQAA